MAHRIAFFCGVFACLVAARPAFAQDSGKVGIEIASGSSIGVVWRVTDRVALRPGLSITKTHTEITTPQSVGGTTATSTSDGWTTSGVIAANFYGPQKENLRMYFSPRVSFFRTHSTAVSLGTVSDITSKNYSAAASVGTEYALHRKLYVFIEAGGAFTWQPEQTSASLTKTKNHSIGTRAAIGAAFVF